MANIQPSAEYTTRFPPANDADDLLHPDGTLTHGGRAYRRQLIAHIAGTMIRNRGCLVPADAQTILSSANRVIEALVADRPRYD